MTMTSKQSETQSPQNDQRHSTKSWKRPEPDDVLSYAYLWADEFEKGREEGRKDRPVVVVVARIARGEQLELLVAPITHSEPARGDGVELPPPVKRHLGLDRERSWIVATEMNRFTWPGPDVRLVLNQDSPYYGAIPARLFEDLRTAILRHQGGNRLRMPTRTE